MPADKPVTIPVVEPILATPELLLHVPPVTALVSVTVDATHSAVGPVIAAGGVFTVTDFVTMHPVPRE